MGVVLNKNISFETKNFLVGLNDLGRIFFQKCINFARVIKTFSVKVSVLEPLICLFKNFFQPQLNYC